MGKCRFLGLMLSLGATVARLGLPVAAKLLNAEKDLAFNQAFQAFQTQSSLDDVLKERSLG